MPKWQNKVHRLVGNRMSEPYFGSMEHESVGVIGMDSGRCWVGMSI